MNRTRPSARIATADDFLRYAGRMPPAEWCIAESVGYAAERNGELVALGIVTWDHFGRAWGWFDTREALPALMLHRKAKAMLAVLRAVGEPVIYAGCDYTIAGAEKWLRRLGFIHDPEMSSEERSVWRCNLS